MKVRTNVAKQLHRRKFAHGELPLGRIIPQGNLAPLLQSPEIFPHHANLISWINGQLFIFMLMFMMLIL